jgi:hypothetical protein
MKRYLFLFLLVAGGTMAVFAVVPPNIEKVLNGELKKLSKNQQTGLSILPTPDKYKLNGNYYEISGIADFRFAYSGRVFTNRNGQISTQSNEFIDYLMLFDSDFIVRKIKVIDFKGTTGQGICSAGWLKQFVGHKPGKLLQVGKEIDAISGATSTVNSISFDIQAKTNILYEIKKSK